MITKMGLYDHIMITNELLRGRPSSVQFRRSKAARIGLKLSCVLAQETIMRRLLIVTLLLCALLSPIAIRAQSAALRLEFIADGFLYPLGISFPPTLPGTVFVTTLNGYVWVVQDGKILQQPFLNIKRQITMDIF